MRLRRKSLRPEVAMNSAELIGRVGAEYLRARIEADGGGEDSDGTARFIIDCLSAEQTASIAAAVLGDPQLKNLVEVKLPAHFVSGYSLPDSALTDKPATHFRN